jgi:hypothetical protein
MSCRQMLAACQVLYTPSAVCLGCTQVKKACICPTIITQMALIFLSINLVKECRLGSMGRHSTDLCVLTCLFYIWRFRFSTLSMLMFGKWATHWLLVVAGSFPSLPRCQPSHCWVFWHSWESTRDGLSVCQVTKKSSSCMQVANCSSTEVVEAYCFKNCKYWQKVGQEEKWRSSSDDCDSTSICQKKTIL